MRLTLPKLPSVFWIAATAMLLAAVALATGTHFETMDDVVISALAAGRLFSDAPNEHLVYTNVLIGLPLTLAYRLSRDTPWYGLYLLASLVMVTAAFLLAFQGLLASWRGRALVATLLLGTVSTAVSTLQYTRVALLAVESGWILLAVTLARDTSRRRTHAAAGGCLVLLGTCIRQEAGILGTILCAPVVLAAVMTASEGRSWPTRRRIAAVPAAVILACGLAIGVDGAYYRAQPSWREFLAYHRARTRLMGTARGESDRIPGSVLARIGWSANDLSMMYSYFGLNETVFSLEHQQAVIDATAGWRWPFDLRSARALLALRTSRFVPLFALAALAGLTLAADAFSAGTILASAAVLTGVLALLSADWKLPERFFEPALSVPAATALALLVLRRDARRPRGRLVSIVSAVTCASTLVLAVWHLQRVRQDAFEREADHAKVAAAMAARTPDRSRLYVSWGGDFPYNALVTPLGRFPDADDFQVFPVVWTNHLPLLRPRLVQLGIGDIHTALWQKPNVYLISSGDRCARMAEFLSVHYGQLVSCVLIDDALSVYRVTPATRRGPSFNVRWQAAVSADDRTRLETRYGLQRPRPLEDRTWRYEFASVDRGALRALVHDTRVEDTAGLDRRTGAIVNPQPDW